MILRVVNGSRQFAETFDRIDKAILHLTLDRPRRTRLDVSNLRPHRVMTLEWRGRTLKQ